MAAGEREVGPASEGSGHDEGSRHRADRLAHGGAQAPVDRLEARARSVPRNVGDRVRDGQDWSASEFVALEGWFTAVVVASKSCSTSTSPSTDGDIVSMRGKRRTSRKLAREPPINALWSSPSDRIYGAWDDGLRWLFGGNRGDPEDPLRALESQVECPLDHASRQEDAWRHAPRGERGR